jgi:hypothetical protein
MFDLVRKKMKKQDFVSHPWRKGCFEKELFKGATYIVKDGKPWMLTVFLDSEDIEFQFYGDFVPESIIINEHKVVDFHEYFEMIKYSIAHFNLESYFHWESNVPVFCKNAHTN